MNVISTLFLMMTLVFTSACDEDKKKTKVSRAGQQKVETNNNGATGEAQKGQKGAQGKKPGETGATKPASEGKDSLKFMFDDIFSDDSPVFIKSSGTDNELEAHRIGVIVIGSDDDKSLQACNGILSKKNVVVAHESCLPEEMTKNSTYDCSQDKVGVLLTPLKGEAENHRSLCKRVKKQKGGFFAMTLKKSVKEFSESVLADDLSDDDTLKVFSFSFGKAAESDKSLGSLSSQSCKYKKSSEKGFKVSDCDGGDLGLSSGALVFKDLNLVGALSEVASDVLSAKGSRIVCETISGQACASSSLSQVDADDFLGDLEAAADQFDQNFYESDFKKRFIELNLFDPAERFMINPIRAFGNKTGFENALKIFPSEMAYNYSWDLNSEFELELFSRFTMPFKPICVMPSNEKYFEVKYPVNVLDKESPKGSGKYGGGSVFIEFTKGSTTYDYKITDANGLPQVFIELIKTHAINGKLDICADR